MFAIDTHKDGKHRLLLPHIVPQAAWVTVALLLWLMMITTSKVPAPPKPWVQVYSGGDVWVYDPGRFGITDANTKTTAQLKTEHIARTTLRWSIIWLGGAAVVAAVTAIVAHIGRRPHQSAGGEIDARPHSAPRSDATRLRSHFD